MGDTILMVRASAVQSAPGIGKHWSLNRHHFLKGTGEHERYRDSKGASTGLRGRKEKVAWKTWPTALGY